MEARTRTYPELSIPAVVLGAFIGVLMTASFVYIALKLGFGLSGSTVAAILGFAVLRGAMKRHSIVENNINQTVASGINTASAGVVFTLPALFLLSVDNPELADFPVGPLIFAAIAGSLMGIVLIIPLRKQMIEFERLKFPSGVAVATLLKSPGEGLAQGLLLLAGAGVAALLTVLVNMGWFPGEADLAVVVEATAGVEVPAWLPIALYISAANFGAGLLSGKGGLPFALGGILAYWVISPIAVSAGWVPAPADLPEVSVAGWQANELYSQMLRPLGIGLLIGGALAGVLAALPAVRGALKSLSAAASVARDQAADAVSGGDEGGGVLQRIARLAGAGDEIDPKLVYVGMAGAFVLLFIAANFATADMGMANALLIAVVGALWLGLAGIIVAQATGHTDISPLSGLALIAVTLMFFLTAGNVTAAVLIGVAVCIATNQCADMMSDLKTGHLVGSIPRKQQVAQLLLCWIGPIVAIGVLMLLWYAPPDGTPGFGPDSTACIQATADCLAAPQAGALQGMIEALQSSDAAVDKYVSGAVMGGALSIFPIGGIGVLVGLAMYLPFSITLAYGVGCVSAMWMEGRFGRRWVGRKLIPVAAGLIVGEAITQLLWNLVLIAQGAS